MARIAAPSALAPSALAQSALAQSALFRALPPEDLQALARAARPCRFEPEEILFRRGTRDGAGLLLLTGAATEGPLVQLTLSDTPARPSRLVCRLVAGELAGDIDLLLSGLQAPLPARLATAQALVGHWALALPAEALAPLVERHGAFRRRLVRDAARRLALFLSLAGPAGPQHPDVAFAAALLDLFDDYGPPGDPAPVRLRRRLAQRDVAALLGMSLRSLSARVTDWDARGLLDSAPLALRDRERIERLALAADQPPAEAAGAAEAQAAALIAEGDRLRGVAMAADALVLWPGHPGLMFLVALGLARSGDTLQAARVLDHPALRHDGAIASLRPRLRAAWARALGRGGDGDDAEEDDPDEPDARGSGAGLPAPGLPAPGLTEARLSELCRDVAALQARLAKDRALALPEGPDRAAALRAAAALYAGVDASLPSAFACANAATLHLLAGDGEKAARLAARARALAAGDGGWDIATRAEACLSLGDPRQAAALAGQAARALAPGDLSTFRRQLAALAQAGIAGAADCLAATDPGQPLVISGPLVLAARMTAAEAARAADDLAARLADALQGRRVASLHASLASGADLLAVSAALEMGIPVDAVIPFPLAQFLETSVAPGAGRDWHGLLDGLLPRLRSLSVLWEGEAPPWTWPGHFRRTDLVLLGEARLAARSMNVRPAALAFGAGSSAAARLAAMAGPLGFDVTLLPPPGAARAVSGADGPAPPAPPSAFAAVVFAEGPDDSPATRARLAGAGLGLRQTRARRAMGELLLPDPALAAATARELAARLAPEGFAVTLDHGPALTRQGTPDAEALARLAARLAARQRAGAAGGTALASAVAGLVLLGQGADPAGLIELAFQTGDGGAAGPRGPGQAARRGFRLV